jgi:hypothetical protein
MDQTKRLVTVPQCRSCHAPIRWVVSGSTGRLMPIDAEPCPNGNLRVREKLSHRGHTVHLADVVSGEELEALRARGEAFLSHHATCPQGRQWQRRNSKRSPAGR